MNTDPMKSITNDTNGRMARMKMGIRVADARSHRAHRSHLSYRSYGPCAARANISRRGNREEKRAHRETRGPREKQIRGTERREDPPANPANARECLSPGVRCHSVPKGRFSRSPGWSEAEPWETATPLPIAPQGAAQFTAASPQAAKRKERFATNEHEWTRMATKENESGFQIPGFEHTAKQAARPPFCL